MQSYLRFEDRRSQLGWSTKSITIEQTDTILVYNFSYLFFCSSV